jgi:hypothetical protein
VLKKVISLDFIKGYRTIAASIAAMAAGLVFLADGNFPSGLQSIATGLGLLGLRFQNS